MDGFYFSRNKHLKRFSFLVFLSFVSLTIYSQGFSVTGKITDTYNEPLIGVNVIEKGSLNGTTTDIDGGFSLNVENGNAVLTFTYIGFEPLEVAIDGKASLNVIMKESTSGT